MAKSAAFWRPVRALVSALVVAVAEVKVAHLQVEEDLHSRLRIFRDFPVAGELEVAD